MINVSRVLHSKNFAQPAGFSVYRKSGGSWISGRFVQTETQITLQGVITPATAKELLQLPEGDRITGTMCIRSDEQIYTTRNGDSPGTSDEIVWNNERYRISSVLPWSDFGYWKAFAVRMVSD